ncbi:MAG: CarD family transcriptional regulator [Clostridia bacterium]|nr:CarD family transcriptional regulator [Clostridia bacterium]
MEFKRGDFVVFPLHGAGVISDVKESVADGETKKYYLIDLPYGNLHLMVPASPSCGTGLRAVIPQSEIGKVLDYIKTSELLPQDPNWNKRQRDQLELMKTGDIYKVADVYKYLAVREKTKALSSGEKKMFISSKKILFSELQLASGMAREEVETAVERCLT